MSVGSFIGAVEPFDHLFEWAVFRRDSILVGKSNDLSDSEGKVFPKLFYEFHCSKGVSTVTVSDELKVFRQLCKPSECHAHGEDAWTDSAVIGYPVTDNGTGCSIHDKPDVSFDPADFDVGFISSKDSILFVRILVYEGLDADSCSLTVVGDLLMGDADVIQIF